MLRSLGPFDHFFFGGEFPYSNRLQKKTRAPTYSEPQTTAGPRLCNGLPSGMVEPSDESKAVNHQPNLLSKSKDEAQGREKFQVLRGEGHPFASHAAHRPTMGSRPAGSGPARRGPGNGGPAGVFLGCLGAPQKPSLKCKAQVAVVVKTVLDPILVGR